MAHKTKQKTAGTLGSEEFEQTKRVILTRATERAKVYRMFDEAHNASSEDSELMKKLFFQAPASHTMSPQLAKMASATPHIDEFFEKLASDSRTEAQRRFPELLTVGNHGR